MKNRVWIKAGDLVLVSIREFEADKGDIILKYNPDENRELRKKGELPDSLKYEAGDKEDEDEDVEFAELEVEPQKKLLMPDSDDDEEEKEELDVDNI